MGLFDYFSRERREERAIIGHYQPKCRYSAGELAKRLVLLWSEYLAGHPEFNPSSRFDIVDVSQWILERLGFDRSDAAILANLTPGKRDLFLGDLAVTLINTDLLRHTKAKAKFAAAMGDVYFYFQQHLPDQVGELKEQYEFWKQA